MVIIIGGKFEGVSYCEIITAGNRNKLSQEKSGRDWCDAIIILSKECPAQSRTLTQTNTCAHKDTYIYMDTYTNTQIHTQGKWCDAIIILSRECPAMHLTHNTHIHKQNHKQIHTQTHTHNIHIHKQANSHTNRHQNDVMSYKSDPPGTWVYEGYFCQFFPLHLLMIMVMMIGMW